VTGDETKEKTMTKIYSNIKSMPTHLKLNYRKHRNNYAFFEEFFRPRNVNPLGFGNGIFWI